MRRLAIQIPAAFDGRTVGDVLRAPRTGPSMAATPKSGPLAGGLGLSRRAITHAKFLEDGILLDGVRVRTNTAVHAGQTLSIAVGDDEGSAAECSVVPQDGPLDIVFEDDDLLVVNKPAGLVMYPNPGHSRDTLGNYLMGYFARTGRQCTLHPVHRLDKGTSGLVVFALNANAQHQLQRSLHRSPAEGGFSREYLAICEGTFAPDELSGTVSAPLGLTGRHPNTYGVLPVESGGKPAVTHYRALASAAPPEGIDAPESAGCAGANANEGEAAHPGGIVASQPARLDPPADIAAVIWGISANETGQTTAGNLASEPEDAPRGIPAGCFPMQGKMASETGRAPNGIPEGCSLLHLRLETGRTHQIRIHLASIGHPLLGDATYGNPSTLIDHPALHSWRIALTHPVSGQAMALEQPAF